MKNAEATLFYRQKTENCSHFIKSTLDTTVDIARDTALDTTLYTMIDTTLDTSLNIDLDIILVTKFTRYSKTNLGFFAFTYILTIKNQCGKKINIL
jgi:hypothetical protein